MSNKAIQLDDYDDKIKRAARKEYKRERMRKMRRKKIDEDLQFNKFEGCAT